MHELKLTSPSAFQRIPAKHRNQIRAQCFISKQIAFLAKSHLLLIIDHLNLVNEEVRCQAQGFYVMGNLHVQMQRCFLLHNFYQNTEYNIVRALMRCPFLKLLILRY